MRHLLFSLALVFAVALAVDYTIAHWIGLYVLGPIHPVMSIGLLMLGAWVTGLIAERISLPAITGYLIYGLLVGPSCLALVPAMHIKATVAPGEPALRFVNDLAISLIALTAGGEIYLAWLRGRLRQITYILLLHMVVLFVGVAAAMLLGRSFVPYMADQSWIHVLVITLLASVVMVAKSPAVTVAMISDYRASGPLSQTTLVMTVFVDLILIVLFATVLAVGRGLLSGEPILSGGFLVAIGVQLIGSVALGALIGLVMAWYVIKIAAHIAIFMVGCCLVIALVGEEHFRLLGWDIHLEPLLMALSAGLLMRNVWPERTRLLFHAIEQMSLPVYCVFFAIAGARIDLRVFGALWMVTVALVLVWLFFTWWSVKLGVCAAKMKGDWPRLLWLGMVSQAGVSLVLVTLIAEKFTYDWAVPLKDTLIGAIFINQLIGPICFRYALLKSGEAYQQDKER